MKPKQYKVTKHFIGGLLDGIVIEEITSVKFNKGFICKKPIGGSPYKILDCVEI